MFFSKCHKSLKSFLIYLLKKFKCSTMLFKGQLYIPSLDVIILPSWSPENIYLEIEILWKELEISQKSIQKQIVQPEDIFSYTSSGALGLYTLFHIIHMCKCSYYFLCTYFIYRMLPFTEVAFRIKTAFSVLHFGELL